MNTQRERKPIEIIEHLDEWSDFMIDQGDVVMARKFKDYAAELAMNWNTKALKEACDLIEKAKDKTGVDL